MAQLNENKFELDLHTKNFYTFQDKNGDTAKISVWSMQKDDVKTLKTTNAGQTVRVFHASSALF